MPMTAAEARQIKRGGRPRTLAGNPSIASATFVVHRLEERAGEGVIHTISGDVYRDTSGAWRIHPLFGTLQYLPRCRPRWWSWRFQRWMRL
jgi:hypothetical protein